MLQEELNAYKKKEKNKKSKVYDNNNINEGDFIENKFKLILNENIIKRKTKNFEIIRQI